MLLQRWWRKRQRDIDMRILWPTCCKLAKGLDDAKLAFFTHAVNDPAWTNDFTRQEIVEFVSNLESV